jgi:hypothetical protein
MRIPVPELVTSIFLFLCLSSSAQLKLNVADNDLKNNLSQVVSDYVGGFSSLKSDTIIVQPQSIEFATRLNFKGCEMNSITQYKSEHPFYSWEALLLTSEDFDEASKKYKWLFNQLKLITINAQEPSMLSVEVYNAPDESKKFCSNIFKLASNTIDNPKLNIEASIRFEFPEWKVNLLVYERERKDDERGDIEED